MDPVTVQNYFLGCPIWGRKDWVGELFPPKTQARDFLERYAELFNCVEGNTTFYGLPSPNAVARWREQTPPTFAFCFKFPRVITHDRRLRDADADTRMFIDTLAPLGERLGPSFVQLPPSFAPPGLPVLAAYLDGLPAGEYAVEVRHPAFFTDTPARARLDDMLAERGVDRVLIDTRGLHGAQPEQIEALREMTVPALREAQAKKPRVPLYCGVTGERPFVRYIGHPRVEANEPLLVEWAARIAEWIRAGKRPYVFVHMPNDFYAPRVARRLHALVSAHIEVGELPAWPRGGEAPPQLDLFG